MIPHPALQRPPHAAQTFAVPGSACSHAAGANIDLAQFFFVFRESLLQLAQFDPGQCRSATSIQKSAESG
jgi:hypothetical protein